MIRKTTDNTKFDNQIFNEDCRQTIQKMIQQGYKVDNIITSPFYNTGRSSQCHTSQKSRDNHEGRYDIHLDDMTNDEYIQFTVDLFLSFDKILQDNGCILYNMSYGSENTELMWLTIASIIQNTPFTIADDIIWKKKSALPNNVSPNKLTRIVEHVLAFCRKSEFKTFKANKKVKSTSKTGQKYYENVFNFIEAQNNDGANKLNKATYSTELITKLINIYVQPNSKIYDPFIGTGTTANACLLADNITYIGSEISKKQCEYAEKRIQATKTALAKNQKDTITAEKY